MNQEVESDVSQVSDDNPESSSFCLNWALGLCFQDSKTCFLTMGNYPRYRIGIKCDGEEIFVMSDSHRQDEEGKCSTDGKTVILIEGPLTCQTLFNTSETLICFDHYVICFIQLDFYDEIIIKINVEF